MEHRWQSEKRWEGKWREKRGYQKKSWQREENSSSPLYVSVVGELSLWVVLTDGIIDLWPPIIIPCHNWKALAQTYRGREMERQGTPLMSAWSTVLRQCWRLCVGQWEDYDPADAYKELFIISDAFRQIKKYFVFSYWVSKISVSVGWCS